MFGFEKLILAGAAIAIALCAAQARAEIPASPTPHVVMAGLDPLS
jgi:hypothetical protein